MGLGLIVFGCSCLYIFGLMHKCPSCVSVVYRVSQKKRGFVKMSDTNITQLFLRNQNVFTNKICLILHKVISFELSRML